MNPANNAPQTFNGEEVFIIHGVLLLSLVLFFCFGLYVAKTRWPADPPGNTFFDILSSLPIACILIWSMLPRFGLAGDILMSSYAAGNPTPLTTLLLCWALMMISGMSFYFALPRMKEFLVTSGGQILTRMGAVFHAAFGSGNSAGGLDKGSGPPSKRHSRPPKPKKEP